MLIRTEAIADKGVLARSVYHWHDDKQSNAHHQVYAVGVNKVEARHWFNVEYGHWRYNYLVPTGDVANMLKYGKAVVRGADGKTFLPLKKLMPAPKWVPASPYLRPTWDAKAQEALRAMQHRLIERIRELRAEGANAAPEAMP